MPKGDNWTKEETQSNIQTKAREALAKIKKERIGKKYILIKVSNNPLTFKEVEVEGVEDSVKNKKKKT
jgi:hypothetical protein